VICVRSQHKIYGRLKDDTDEDRGYIEGAVYGGGRRERNNGHIP
jgi:hypothetical protein